MSRSPSLSRNPLPDGAERKHRPVPGASVFPGNRPAVLARLRHRLRSAWILHGYLIGTVAMFPAYTSRTFADEGDPPPTETWTQQGTQSYLSVSLSAPEGTTDVSPDSTRALLVTVREYSWELWTSDLGGSELRNESSSPMSAAAVSLVLESGNATLPDPANGLTDMNGQWSGSLIMGSQTMVVRADVTTSGGTSASASLTISPSEVWSYDRAEGLLTVTLSAPEGTTDIAQGAQRAVTAHVQYDTWEIWTSNYGGERVQNAVSAPASQAQITWSVLDVADGQVSDAAPLADTEGNATATFTMGAGASTLKADVNYAGIVSASATLGFTPEPAPAEEWSYDHDETGYSINLSASGPTADVAAGTQFQMTAGVLSSSWEVWVSNYGNAEVRNQTPEMPAPSATVSFALESGDGAISQSSELTDSSGSATIGFTMGSAWSRLAASVGDPAAGGASASVDFTPHEAPEEWTYVGDESGYAIILTADGASADLEPGGQCQITAELTSSSWEVWVSNYGNTEARNVVTSVAPNETMTFEIVSGDGAVSPPTVTTDSSGRATTTFAMGAQESRLRAVVGDPASGGADSVLDFTPPPPEEWIYDHTEGTISTTLSANGATTELPAGTQRTVTAQVIYDSWDVSVSNRGNTRLENFATGPAIGAAVAFSVSGAGGSISTTTATTDANGLAATVFVMGSSEAQVQADVSYAGATGAGTLTFSPESWILDHTDASLTLTLEAGTASGMTVPIIATATYTTWEVWVHPTLGTQTRNYTSGPGIGASVAFSVGGQTSTVSTDGNGQAVFSFTASAYDQASTVDASVAFAGLAANATLSVSVSEPPPSCNACGDTNCPQTNCTCGGNGGCSGKTNCAGCSDANCPGSGCSCYGSAGCGVTQNCTGCNDSGCPGQQCGCNGGGGCTQQEECSCTKANTTLCVCAAGVVCDPSQQCWLCYCGCTLCCDKDGCSYGSCQPCTCQRAGCPGTSCTGRGWACQCIDGCDVAGFHVITAERTLFTWDGSFLTSAQWGFNSATDKSVRVSVPVIFDSGGYTIPDGNPVLTGFTAGSATYSAGVASPTASIAAESPIARKSQADIWMPHGPCPADENAEHKYAQGHYEQGATAHITVSGTAGLMFEYKGQSVGVGASGSNTMTENPKNFQTVATFPVCTGKPSR